MCIRDRLIPLSIQISDPSVKALPLSEQLSLFPVYVDLLSRACRPLFEELVEPLQVFDPLELLDPQLPLLNSSVPFGEDLPSKVRCMNVA